MQLGMVGLGRMGANMVRRLVAHGHECVVFDVSPKVVADMAKENGIAGSSSLQDFVSKLAKPRAALVIAARPRAPALPAMSWAARAASSQLARSLAWPSVRQSSSDVLM